jgi:hypothetical protein
MAFSPFAYGTPKDAGNQIYNMTPGNVPPALIVWLYMVSAFQYLDALDAVGDPAGDFSDTDLPFDEIVQATNLKPEAVRAILACYINDAPELKSAWRHVVTRFQAFSQQTTAPTVWTRDNCPAQGILSLATNGALVNPNS